jgi:hypothetical protein
VWKNGLYASIVSLSGRSTRKSRNPVEQIDHPTSTFFTYFLTFLNKGTYFSFFQFMKGSVILPGGKEAGKGNDACAALRCRLGDD